MKRRYKRAELAGRAQLIQTLKSLVRGRASSLPHSPRLTDFCEEVWAANTTLRRYVSDLEVNEIFDFAEALVGQGRSVAEAAEETIDLLSQAVTILGDQIKQPKVGGLLCPIRSLLSLPGLDTKEGVRLGAFRLFRCSEEQIASLEERFRHYREPLETDEFGYDNKWDMNLSRDELREVGIYSFPEALRECCANRICFLAETPRSPHTLWPGPVGLGGMYDVYSYESQVLERFQNLVRYLYPEFSIVVDGPRIDLDYDAGTALVASPAEPGTTDISERPFPKGFVNSLQTLDNVLRLASKIELARCLEGAVFWVGSATGRVERTGGTSVALNATGAVDYLKYMIALESLLVYSANNVTEAVSSRVAHILEKEYVQIEHFKKRMKRLYGIRSRIVHDGEWYVSPPDLAELEKITRKLIDTLLLDPERWESKPELAKWVELKEWVTSQSPNVHTSTEKVRQWISAIEETQPSGHNRNSL